MLRCRESFDFDGCKTIDEAGVVAFVNISDMSLGEATDNQTSWKEHLFYLAVPLIMMANEEIILCNKHFQTCLVDRFVYASLNFNWH
jgi:hypothetical protein